MTAQRAEKQAARDYAKKHEISYTAALRAVRAARDTAPHEKCRPSWDGELATYTLDDGTTMCRTCQTEVLTAPHTQTQNAKIGGCPRDDMLDA